MASVTSGGAEIYYEVHGSGPALVFAYGRGGNGASWWQQVPYFSAHYKVVVFDHRGFARSSGGGENFTQRQLAEDLIAILDAEGLERAALVAQSMGGWTCLGAALHHPRRVTCLVMTSTYGGLSSPEMEDHIAQVRSRRDAPGQSFAGRALAPDYPAREPAMAMLYEQLRAFNTDFDPRRMGLMLDSADGIRPEALAGYTIPTLFLIGGQDQIFPPELLRMAARLVPGAQTEEFPNAGHSPYWEDAAIYNEVVEKFLRRQLGG
ncbi:MAG: alpha/beta fold hydrolase [SAR324 cluster bacterium]|nr:alpha/beta fold hydrolase [SAR324 cluster bacterium]